MEFKKFDKIPRLSREIIITEKLDGTNAQVCILNRQDLEMNSNGEVDYKFIEQYCLYRIDDLFLFAGSRKRWLDISSKGDNFGFAKWVKENTEDLFKLGEGRHFGEWYGKGIQRGYGLAQKRFALFNIKKWVDDEIRPICCDLVPRLWIGNFDTLEIDRILEKLKLEGSKAVEGFMKPEGIIIYHTHSGRLFKKTCENDEKPKTHQ